MRVYFIGAHSTGKTTLTQYVSKQYNLNSINEIARSIIIEQEINLASLRSNLDLVDNFQTTVLCRQIEKEELLKDNFVSDRSFDNLAYTAQHSRNLSKLLNNDKLKKYIETLKEKDSYLFFVRPSKATLQDDGIRENPIWEGVIAIDAMVKFMLEMFDLPYYQINTDNMQERIRFIDCIINRK